jgi:hypothetical protein
VIVRPATLMSRGLLNCSDSVCPKKDRPVADLGGHQKMNGDTKKHAFWHLRKRYSIPLREAIPLWFAVSSPLTGLILGLLGAWFFTWLTS